MDDFARKKRLGQYFTGVPLARLLATCAGAKKASTILDPMCGDGDMLVAASKFNPKTQPLLAGIEIDPQAYYLAQKRIQREAQGNEAALVLGSAFDPSVLRKLPETTYDLVITNPPYVRYQTLSENNGDDELPDAPTVRRGLFDSVNLFDGLDEVDRRLLTQIIANYSGLSDLAVPAWILCAMLTKIGGTLAMVVSESWLNRDYAQAIHYMLLRWFRLRYVIEDTDAVWFDNALIKTNLIVAERIKRRPTAFDWQQETYTFVQISAAAANKRSVVGNVFPGHLEPEAELLEVIERGEEETLRNESQSIEIEPRKLAQKANMLLNKLSQSSWLMELESGRPVDYSHPNRNVEVRGAVLRSEILTWLTEDGGNKRFTTLESLGVQAGQGLRTGANRFFYVDIDIAKNITSSVTPNPMFNMGAFTVPSNCLQIVLRKQAELDEGLLLEPERLRGRAMVLTEYILPADMDEALPYPEVYRKLKQAYRPMPEELAEYVKNATKINLGTLEKPKYIPHMSAVRTNVRSIVPNNPEALPRFWYMLPPFTKRHRSDLFIPRVNHKHPRTYINSVQPVLIDANFSTLWLDKNSSINVYSLLALMNSTWCVVNMELQALIMGGGALKLEATHLRKLPIPELPPLGWEKLEGWGRALAKGNYNSVIIKQIDLFLMMTLFDDAHGVAKLTELENMSSKLLEKRVR